MSLMTIEELSHNSGLKLESYHEVARDSMLEKMVLISVAYFCIATEMRFLAKGAKSADNVVNPLQKESEAFHAKAVHIAAQFLPRECPLVDYIVKSYHKNYLKDKVIK